MNGRTVKGFLNLRRASTSKLHLKYALLPTRALIRLDSPPDDAASLLHGLVTIDIKSLANPQASCYTAFLNAPGRILNDGFIYAPSETDGFYHVEVDLTQSEALIKHLQKHRLRRRIKFSLADTPVYAIWSDDPDITQTSLQPYLQSLRYWRPDQRPFMGARCLSQPKESMEELFGPPATYQEYTVHRMLNGIAEGPEIVPESALPLESNFDLAGAIDFRKGCYLGQELTIRTHHTGIVRKRIVPVQLYTESRPIAETPTYDPDLEFDIPTDTQLQPSGAQKAPRSRSSAGKWLGGVGNVGLALCRLERISDIRLTEDAVAFDPEQEFVMSKASDSSDTVKARPFVLPWMREAIARQIASLRKT